MPTYNCESYIEKSIQSVIDQSYLIWELIIINDGSIDNTLDICKKYAHQDSRIKVFSQKNKGVSVARNKGITNAVGKYISFLDSDDTYHKDFLSKLLDSITENNGYDISYCGFDCYVNHVFTHSSEKHYQKGNIIQNYLHYLRKQKHICSICSILINSNFLKKSDITFTAGNSNGEDTAFLIKIFSNANVNFVPYNLFYYRVGREGAATNNDLSIAVISILDCYTDSYNFLLNKHTNNEEIIILAKNLIDDEFKYWLYYAVKRKNYNLFIKIKSYNPNKPTLPWSIWLLLRPILKLYLKLQP